MTGNKELSEEQSKDFRNWVFSIVVDNYKDGLLAEKRTRWALTKAWNSRQAHIGIPRTIRENIGEEAATKLFQDEADEFRLTPKGISYINEVRAMRQSSKDTEDIFNQR